MTLDGVRLAPQGFGSATYARSLAEFGEPTALPECGAWFLRRAIPGATEHDGLGGYPFLVCRDWSRLPEDLEAAGRELVSFAAVADPFGEHGPDLLRRCFPDLCVHFKDHYVADLRLPTEKVATRNHRRYARRALRQVSVEFHESPAGVLEEWLALFGETVRRFGLTGLRAYSRQSFGRLLAMPGVVVSLARQAGEPVAAHLFVVDGEVCTGHLAAVGARSRETGAAYAVYLSAIEYFRGRVRWLDWGGEAGIAAASGGLASFKRGWATGTRPVYFCGRVFDRERYEQIVREQGIAPTKYFPAYRSGEFG